MTDQAGTGGDIGRRLALRRDQLGLTAPEAAERAGVDPGYLRYVEEQPGASPGPGFLQRLAEALDTTVSRLRGGDAGVPPGAGRAARNPVLTELDPAECRALLADHGIGRIAVAAAQGPAIIPVNYDVVDGTVVFRTAPGTAPALAADSVVAFEVDRIDDALSQGWSVNITGSATRVTDPEDVRRLVAAAHTAPWAGGEREEWVRVDPVLITGRRVTAA
ncbi:helix-turn-helix domain-containing protein [Actinacidiphila sp. ITFR-21]|uniref:helix-turn-helix domain-containing protein n=1 Tax=Actinacidiphila sp. ITFR-21 TaxID=3075199 RepID=UPI00288C21BC|nr:pyridoxamine 5'-phosphate oxidase family protein [Streptomyces sp. ITFR-21]WNI14326.1 pyridoxamine 5'-phosphate oxidase family protein [Streptomyces sp. ITFR-21]